MISYPNIDRAQATGSRKGARELMAWAGRRLWPAVRTVIRAVRLAHHEQVSMWECVLLTSGAAPLTAAGPLRWVRSLERRFSPPPSPARCVSPAGSPPDPG